MSQLEEGIPNCAAVLGSAVGLGAARAASCHFSVMAGDIGALFNAGPKIVEGATFEEDLTYALDLLAIESTKKDQGCRTWGTTDSLL